MTRKQALATVTAEFAEHGKATATATRAYIENRIGMQAYNLAARTGLTIFDNTLRIK